MELTVSTRTYRGTRIITVRLGAQRWQGRGATWQEAADEVRAELRGSQAYTTAVGTAIESILSEEDLH